MPCQNERSIRELNPTHKLQHADDTCARICVSYYSLQVIQQVAGHNAQALDLSEQAQQLITWMTTDF